MRKSLTITVFVVLLALSSFGLSAQDSEISLGVSLPAVEGLFFEAFIQSAQTYAEDEGINFQIMDAAFDAETEQENVQTLLDSGIDALLLMPVDVMQSAASVALANEADVPVFLLHQEIVYDMDEMEVEIAGLIAPSGESVGALAGEYMCQLLEDGGNVLEAANFDMMMEDDSDEEDDMGDNMNTMSHIQMISESFGTYIADECSGVEVTMFSVADVEADDLFDTLEEAMSETTYSGLVAYNPTTLIEGVNVAFATRNLGLITVGFTLNQDIIAGLELGDIEAVILPEAETFGAASLEAAAAYLAEGTMPDLSLEAVVLDSGAFSAVRCSGGCD